MPIKELKNFRRLYIPAGQERHFQLSIPVKELQKWDLATGKWKLYPGRYKLIIGSDSRAENLFSDFTIGRAASPQK
jgi:beta-glucosidase